MTTANAGTGKGYTSHGPTSIDGTLPLKVGLTLETNRQSDISGLGKTLGMVCSRADDQDMPTWEMYWKIRLEK
jgi:hypothetical protein